MWQVSWAHPKFGSVLASCGYEGKVIIWKQSGSKWIVVKEWTGHSASGKYYQNNQSFITIQSTASHGLRMSTDSRWPAALRMARLAFSHIMVCLIANINDTEITQTMERGRQTVLVHMQSA